MSPALAHQALRPLPWVGVLPLMLALVVALPGCKCGSEPTGGGDDTAAKPTTSELPPLELREDTPNLLLTWIDEKGDFHVVQKIADVPEKSRENVRVVVTTREEGTGKLVYVANLSKKNPDGSFVVRTSTRAAWDEMGAARRQARLEALAPPPASAAPSASASAQAPDPLGTKGIVAIIYGADWCKPCHDAERYLKQRGVEVVMKNVEDSQVAAREMSEKLRRARRSGASIPVIDLNGQILVGFSPHALDRAIETARNAKTL